MQIMRPCFCLLAFSLFAIGAVAEQHAASAGMDPVTEAAVKDAIESLSRTNESEVDRVMSAFDRVKSQPNQAALAALIPCLDSKEDNKRRAAIYMIQMLAWDDPQPAFAPLRRLLTHEEPATRLMAAMALASQGDKDSYDAFVKLLQEDKDKSVQICCIWALGELGVGNAVDVLRETASSGDPLVATSAKNALERLTYARDKADLTGDEQKVARAVWLIAGSTENHEERIRRAVDLAAQASAEARDKVLREAALDDRVTIRNSALLVWHRRNEPAPPEVLKAISEKPGAPPLPQFASAKPTMQPPDAGIQARGTALLQRMAYVNQYWIEMPPPSIKSYSYDYSCGSYPAKTVKVAMPVAAEDEHRAATTFWAGINFLLMRHSAVNIVSIEDKPEGLLLEFALKNPARIGCGNGMDGSWIGYYSSSLKGGTLLLDPKRAEPLELKADNQLEQFADYVEVGEGHCVPLKILITHGGGAEGMYFDWRFNLHPPGLWLLGEAYYHFGEAEKPERVAFTANVTVNGEKDVIEAAAKEEAEKTAFPGRGREAVRRLIEANRVWLLPPLDVRRGLAYDYLQEGQYHERVVFDTAGNILVRLVSNKEGAEKDARQLLFTPDARRISIHPIGRHQRPVERLALDTPESKDEPVIDEQPIQGPVGVTGEALLHLDRQLNNLATGLGWDCALTQLARNPSDFEAEVKEIDGGRYELKLTSHRRAKLFTGTMLTFSSWAYMHDVKFETSTIVCDAASNRPFEEKDYDQNGKLVGSYTFNDYLSPSSATGEPCTAPSRITAVIPYEKDAADKSLDMEASFQFARSGIWLLEKCHSQFRGDTEGSTGTAQLADATEADFKQVADVLERARAAKNKNAQVPIQE